MGSQVDLQTLIDSAWEARDKAYAPYSTFRVGAALLTDSGKVFAGCNVENISFGLTVCAERAAVIAAVAGGERKFASIAIVAETDLPIVPCGACRQFLAEFSPAMRIVSEGNEGARTSWMLSLLLPTPQEGILNRQG